MSSDYIRTYVGRKVWPFSLTADQVCLADIACSLARQCRFTGHTHAHYSVAQHSTLMVEYNRTACDPRVLLLHDAMETYLGDIATPNKRKIKRDSPEWAEAERAGEEIIFSKYIPEWSDLRGTPRGDYKPMDHLILVSEMRQLVTNGAEDWPNEEPDLGIQIDPVSVEDAESRFLAMAWDIGIRD